MADKIQHEEAVSSVVGEMILMVLVIILVSLFASSAFSLLPGDREASVDVAMKNVSGDSTVIFWHKGGDWVEKKNLEVVVIGDDRSRQEYTTFDLYDEADNLTSTFDLGGYLKVKLKKSLQINDTLRLVTTKNVIYSGEILK